MIFFHQVRDTCCCQYYIHNTSRSGICRSLVSPSRTYAASVVISGAKIRSIRVRSSRNSSQPSWSRGTACPIVMGRKCIRHQHQAVVCLISNSFTLMVNVTCLFSSAKDMILVVTRDSMSSFSFFSTPSSTSFLKNNLPINRIHRSAITNNHEQPNQFYWTE